jgi:hypothetical protein
MPSADELLNSMRRSAGAAVFAGQTLDSLDLRGSVFDAPLNLSGARITGAVDLSQAELRGGLIAHSTHFVGGLAARRCQIHGDVMLAQACFGGPIDLSWTHVQGRVYAWRARFQAEARFRQLIVAPGAGADKSFVWPGEANFSWAWFHGPAQFERCEFNGPAYFWRTRFLQACSFDEASFEADATFMGMPSEVCLSRTELGWANFQRLEDLGLIRRDDEEVAIIDGQERAMFGQLAGVHSVQELHQRMDAVDLAPRDRMVLEAQFRRHSGPMFAGQASLQRLRVVQPRQVKFIAVNGLHWDLSGTTVDAIAFFDAAQRPVPTNVGLGHAYDRVFISYGGPDQPLAARFNRALQNVGVDTFYYPEDSVPGREIDHEMREGVSGYDRVLLLCSTTSPQRPGWRFELMRALDREKREDASEVLIVVAIDDGLWQHWPADLEVARQRLLARTVADFRGTLDEQPRFDDQLARLLLALRKADPATPT